MSYLASCRKVAGLKLGCSSSFLLILNQHECESHWRFQVCEGTAEEKNKHDSVCIQMCFIRYNHVKETETAHSSVTLSHVCAARRHADPPKAQNKTKKGSRAAPHDPNSCTETSVSTSNNPRFLLFTSKTQDEISDYQIIKFVLICPSLQDLFRLTIWIHESDFCKDLSWTKSSRSMWGGSTEAKTDLCLKEFQLRVFKCLQWRGFFCQISIFPLLMYTLDKY